MISCKTALPITDDIDLPDDLIGLDILLVGDDYQPIETDVGIMVDYFNSIIILNPEFQQLLDENYDYIMNYLEYDFQQLLREKYHEKEIPEDYRRNY